MTDPALRRPFAALLTSAAMLALGACHHAAQTDAGASADNVEMPAEEALSGVTAQPVPDPAAAASGADSAADAATSAQ